MPVIVNVIRVDQLGTITGMICDYAGPKGEVIFDRRHNVPSGTGTVAATLTAARAALGASLKEDTDA